MTSKIQALDNCEHLLSPTQRLTVSTCQIAAKNCLEHPGVLGSQVSSGALHHMEPATPPGGSALHRDDPACTSISSSNLNPLAAFPGINSNPGLSALGDEGPWGSWPKVGAQWAIQQETIQVGCAMADCSLPVSLHQQQLVAQSPSLSSISTSEAQCLAVSW